jgi:hypothetical protein
MAILCHVRVASAIFWGADKTSVGEPVLIVSARISISSAFAAALQMAHVLHGSGADFMTAGSHKTHCHGIAVEIAFFVALGQTFRCRHSPINASTY